MVLKMKLRGGLQPVHELRVLMNGWVERKCCAAEWDCNAM